MRAILNSLFENHMLTRFEAKDALLQITNGNSNSTQTTAFITAYLMRKITVEELTGFRDALLETGHRVNLSEFNPMDLCGTGGDNKNTFNISTLSAFVAAGAGVWVAKHGNYAISSSCGSSNILEYFGYKFTNSVEKLKYEMSGAGICFLHAPLFQSSLKAVSGIRKDLQCKTFFNMLGPLINPASPGKQMLGVYSKELALLYSQILKNSSNDYQIIYSEDGYDEISLTGPYRKITRFSDKIYHPEQEGFTKVTHESIIGGSNIDESAQIFLNILNGKGTIEQNEVVIANAASAINCYFPMLEKSDAKAMARESLISKKALLTFKKLIG